jgi:hypothetical protein
VDDENLVDEDHDMGITSAAWESLTDMLSGQGYGMLNVEKVEGS